VDARFELSLVGFGLMQRFSAVVADEPRLGLDDRRDVRAVDGLGLGLVGGCCTSIELLSAFCAHCWPRKWRGTALSGTHPYSCTVNQVGLTVDARFEVRLFGLGLLVVGCWCVALQLW
jgi:hypothetical protein